MWPAIISAGANIFGSLFSAKSQAQTNKANSDQAQREMEFQERMSSTAHQREVADLKAAGLNPILSANAGASTPVGAMATFQNPYATLPHDLATSAATLADVQVKKAQVNNLNASTAKTIAETKPKSELNKAIDLITNGVANSARWLGEQSVYWQYGKPDLRFADGSQR